MLQLAQEGQACDASTAWSIGRDCHRRHHQVRLQRRSAQGMSSVLETFGIAIVPVLVSATFSGPDIETAHSASTAKRIKLQLSGLHPDDVLGV